MRQLLSSASRFMVASAFSLFVVSAVVVTEAIGGPLFADCHKETNGGTGPVYCIGNDDCDTTNGEYCSSIGVGGTRWVCSCD